MEENELYAAVGAAMRKGNWNQVSMLHRAICEEMQGRSFSTLRANDIIWELLQQGVLAPGCDDTNLDLPFLHLTDYGKQCLDDGDFTPQDPAGYISRLRTLIGEELDAVVLAYLRESLVSIQHGLYLAAAVMLGVVSERCMDLLQDAWANALTDRKTKEQFKEHLRQAGRTIKRRFDIIRDNILAQPFPAPPKDSLDLHLSGVFTLLRYTRNDAGHPTERSIDRQTAYANHLLFPQYCKRVYDLIAHLRDRRL